METSNQIASKKTLGSILKVAASNIIKLLSGILIGFLLPKIIGVTDYGYYKTFTLYATYVGLFHFGFADGIYLKFGGKDYDQLDKGRFRFYTTFLFCLESAISLIAAVIAYFALNGELKFIFLCLAAYLLSTNIINHYQIISQITGRFNELSLRTIVQALLTGLAVVVLWLIQKFSDTVITYRIYTIIYVAVNFILTVWYIFTYRDITFGRQDRSEKGKIFWEFIKLGFPLLVANLCSSFILSIDRQFVSILFDTDTYAIYSFAYNMLGMISIALSAISTVVYPTLKRTDEKTLKGTYSPLISVILVAVFICLTVYFPLCWFVNWFLPKYTDSLIIFRIILPGVAISSAITIVMHNYYKAFGSNFQFFVKSIIILALSALANFLAYYFFKTTVAISIASIIVMVIWYVSIEEYFIRKFKINWIKNFAYMIIMTGGFYGITCINIWWIAMLAYMLFVSAVTCLFYWKHIKAIAQKLINKIKKKNGDKKMPKTVLVTGGTGFIGNCFCKLLLAERPDWKVINVDVCTYAANPHTIDEELKNPNYVFYKKDIRDRQAMEEIFQAEKPDIVVNFAAESHVDRSIKNPTVFLETNIIGTSVLMDCCRKFGIERYHQVSTDEVYGDLPLDRPDLFFHEDTPLHTSSPYSTSKASADLLVLAYYRTYGLPVTISRCSNNYGPYQFPEKLIPLMISKASKEEPLPVYGEGLNVRDWLYVEDHCRGILAVIEKGRVGEVYNLGGHNERNNLYIVKRILSEMGKPESLITHVADRHGHDQRYAIDPHKANVELNWDPVTTFEVGIVKTINWYLSDEGKKWLEECVGSEQEWLKANYEDRK